MCQQHSKQAGVHGKKIENGHRGFRQRATVILACTTAWGRDWEQIEDGLFFLKIKKTGKWPNFLIALLCTPSRVLSQRHTQTEFYVGCDGVPVNWKWKLICFDGKTTSILGKKLNKEKKSGHCHKKLVCAITWIEDHQNKNKLFQKTVLVI